MILSELNLVSLFYKLCEYLLDASDIYTSFELIYNKSINEWAWPSPGQLVEINLNEAMIQVKIPKTVQQGLHY